MKKMKSIPVIQQPVLIAGLVIIVMVSLWFLMMLIPEKQQKESELIGTYDVRSGDQQISVSLVTPGEETYDEYTSRTQEEFDASGIQHMAKSTVTENPPNMLTKAIPADDNVKFRIDRFQKLAVQPLKFDLYDENGKIIYPDYLKSVRGHKVHFYLTHSNLKEFHHLFPNFANNVWNVSVNMPTPGTYYAYVSFIDLYGVSHVYRSDLIVRSESPDDTPRPHPTENLEFFDGDRTAKLTMQRVDTGRLFSIDLSRKGDVLFPEPHLESTGHLSLFKHNEPDFFVSTASNLVKAVSLNPVFFGTPALTTGRYTAFAEIKMDGKVFVFPFTFDIGAL